MQLSTEEVEASCLSDEESLKSDPSQIKRPGGSGARCSNAGGVYSTGNVDLSCCDLRQPTG